ncbi:MAG: sel1 repeat family protein [Paraburkholderia sp.]|uniref:SEL1-like repeat protein n=1 Tax=Paraburkholderia sp. TaxID=1926495 RepID=UPI003C4AA7AE
MKQNTAIAICVALVLCACSNRDNPMPSQADMSDVRAKLTFTCAREADQLLPLDPQADTLFKYALFLEKRDGPKDYNAAGRYYRIAAAYGHYKANHNLQLLVSEGFAKSPDAPKETIDLVEQLIAAGVPGGYYNMGHYLELGYGVKKDEIKARIYFRKAADLGSPEAQHYVSDLLAPLDKAPDIAKQMRQCATDQGYGDAASTLGVDLMTNKLYSEAVNAFQKGVQVGNSQSTSFLENGFEADPSDALYYLSLPKDPERSRRYRAILLFLHANDGLNPKVPDIDQIVPLPPAKLPNWDGTFQWQKEQDAAKPPPKPDDKMVECLAREKNLDPATGLPLTPTRSAKDEHVPPGILSKPLFTWA